MTENISIVVCRKCGVIHETKDIIIETIPLPGGGCHKKASCPTCKSFIKFLPHSAPTLYFGKYKGKPISEIVQKDPSYLHWMLKQNIRSARLKSAIEEALSCPQK